MGKIRASIRETVLDLYRGIAACLDQQLIVPTLMLLYAGIDTMAWLARPEDQDQVRRADFIRWCEDYLLPDSRLKVSGVDLYGARCGILHSMAAESALTASGEAKVIWYAWGSARAEDLQKAIGESGATAAAVHISALLEAFHNGLERFLARAEVDDELGRLVERRAEKFLRNIGIVHDGDEAK